MKIKPYILLILLLAGKGSFAQNPIIERIISHDSTLLVQKAKDWRKFIAVAALDKKTHISYLVTYYGEVIDSARLADSDYQKAILKKFTLFDYHEGLTNWFIEIEETAKTQIRSEGKLDDKWHYSRTAAMITDDKPDKTSLQRIDAFDKAIEYGKIKNWLLKTNIPKAFEQHIKPYPNYDKKKAGTMFVNGDTTFFYNKNNINTVYRAELIRKKAVIRYYKRDSQLIDSVPLNKIKIDALLKLKTDVFLLYKGWLEMQKHNIIKEVKNLDSIIKLKNTAPYQLANFPAQPKELLELVNKENIKINAKIKNTNTIDYRSIATNLVEAYPENKILNKRFLNAIDVGYYESYNTGQVRYELTNHLGNVIAVISDKRIQENTGENNLVRYNADVISSQDFYAFGSEMPQRTFNLEDYPYGFNGKENDNEVKGEGNQQDYGMRIYDPRIGKFLSVDPIAKDYPELTPYQFAGNRPINSVDLDGLEPKSVVREKGKVVEQIKSLNTSKETSPVITKTTYKFTESAAHLLSFVSGISKANILKTEIQNTESGLLPSYDPKGGGGAITFPGENENYRMNFTDNYFNDGYGSASRNENVMSWLSLSSHEVGHIRDINEIGGGVIKYFGTFAKEYALAGSHDDNEREKRADLGTNEFNSFKNFVDKYYGKDKLKSLFENPKNSDKKIENRLNQWFERYKKTKADNIRQNLKDGK